MLKRVGLIGDPGRGRVWLVTKGRGRVVCTLFILLSPLPKKKTKKRTCLLKFTAEVKHEPQQGPLNCSFSSRLTDKCLQSFFPFSEPEQLAFHPECLQINDVLAYNLFF